LTFHVWNYQVLYIVDRVIQIMLIWLILLPCGRTLNLLTWIKDKGKAWQEWKKITISSKTVIFFFLHISIVYLGAGLPKAWNSLWQSGFMLYSILLMEISNVYSWVKPTMLPYVKFLTWSAYISEIMIALLIWAPRSTIFKYIALFLQLTIHLLILFVLKIPIVNLSMLGFVILLYPGIWSGIFFKKKTESKELKVKWDFLWVFLSAVVVMLVLVSQPFSGYQTRMNSFQQKIASFNRGAGLDFFYSVFPGDDIRQSPHVRHDVYMKRRGKDKFEKASIDAVWPQTMRYIMVQKYFYVPSAEELIFNEISLGMYQSRHDRLKSYICQKHPEIAQIKMSREIHIPSIENVNLEDAPIKHHTIIECE